MKVKCINCKEKSTLSINSNYIVYCGEFSLYDYGRKYERFFIQNDDGRLLPYDANSFEIVLNIDNKYIISNLSDDNFKFAHKAIAYNEFLEMFYEDTNTAINDFNIAKKELYTTELNEDEIKAKLTSDNIDERDFIAITLAENKNYHYIKFVIDFCNNELNKWIRNISLQSLFEYLSIFKNDLTDEFFNNYLTEMEKGHTVLNNIAYDYFGKHI